VFQNSKILMQYLKRKYGNGFKSRAELQGWQEKKVQEFLKKILPISNFYRQYHAGWAINDWHTWPIINKKIMMDNFTALNTVGLTKEEAFAVALAAEESRDFTPTVRGVTVGLSSGTSGNRGLFLASKDEQAKWAGAILAKVLPGSLLRPHRIAFFMRANSKLYQTVGKRQIQFEFFDMLRPIDEHIDRLNKFQPTILVGPPSMLRLLADALHNKLYITPAKVVSVAEVLDPLDKQCLEEQFQQTIHQIYQCTEGFLGVTCRYGTLHLNEDLVVIQKDYLDDECRRFSPIITDFSRTSQPIIRYRLDDIITERTACCPCGSPFTAIEQIEGRCDDIFYIEAKTTRRLVPVFPDFIRRAIITADECIIEYVAIQKAESHIQIGLRGHQAGTKERVQNSLDKLWDIMNTVSPHIEFIEIPHKIARRKLRRVERQFVVRWEK